jgi:protein gp37
MPRMAIVSSKADLFHEQVPADFIHRVFQVMHYADGHIFLVTTRTSRRLQEMSRHLVWSKATWTGVSLETAHDTFRIHDLRRTRADVKFLSLEPLLGPLPTLDLQGIDWVIVGGESGPGARLMDPAWVRDIRDQCQTSKVPFFFKQWGGISKKKAGRILDGRTWDDMPSGRGLRMTSPAINGWRKMETRVERTVHYRRATPALQPTVLTRERCRGDFSDDRPPF